MGLFIALVKSATSWDARPKTLGGPTFTYFFPRSARSSPIHGANYDGAGCRGHLESTPQLQGNWTLLLAVPSKT